MTGSAATVGSHQAVPVTPVLLASALESDYAAMRGLLCGSEYLLVQAATWESALNLSGHFVFPVVLYDRLLDGGDWRLAVRRLASGWRIPSVLLLSTEYDRRLRAEAIRAGGFDVLVRPFRRDDVRQRLDAARRNFSSARGKPAR